MQGASGSFVYVVNDEGLVQGVNVQPGLMTKDGGWIIDTGLKAGDKVITSGLMKLHPGLKVNPVVKTSVEP